MSDALTGIPTPDIPSELIRAGFAEPETAPKYRAVYNAILDGRIAAERVNGRYRIHPSQLPQVAALFGLPARTAKDAA
jgi:hypothetical protein